MNRSEAPRLHAGKGTNIPIGIGSESQTDVPAQSAELQDVEIKPGMVIEGIQTLAQLDEFTNLLIEGLLAERTKDGQSKYRINGEDNKHFLSEEIKNQAYRASNKRFNGAIKDFQIAILSPDMSVQKKIVTPRPIKPAEIATFLVKGDMYSTGRGKIGELKRLFTLFVHPNHDYSYYRYHSVHLNSRQIGVGGTQIDTQLLQESSTIACVASQRLALRYVISVGLPELGKKR